MSWPPLVAKEGAQPSGDWTIIARHDDRKQWAYKGKPLYRWDNDKKPGDRRIDNHRWHVVVPSP